MWRTTFFAKHVSPIAALSPKPAAHVEERT
jgi:hypothetical protein